MRYLLGAVALAPFVWLLIAMATGRARVQPCCPPDAPALSDHRGDRDPTPPAHPGT